MVEKSDLILAGVLVGGGILAYKELGDIKEDVQAAFGGVFGGLEGAGVSLTGVTTAFGEGVTTVKEVVTYEPVLFKTTAETKALAARAEPGQPYTLSKGAIAQIGAVAPTPGAYVSKVQEEYFPKPTPTGVISEYTPTEMGKAVTSKQIKKKEAVTAERVARAPGPAITVARKEAAKETKKKQEEYRGATFGKIIRSKLGF